MKRFKSVIYQWTILIEFDYPYAQIDGGVKYSVTNNVDILQNVLWYD